MGKHAEVQRDGCDAFISVKFNGISMKTSPDYATISPEWNTMLTFPVYTPCLTDNIDVQLWDYQGTGPDQLLATITLKFSDILSNQIFQHGLICTKSQPLKCKYRILPSSNKAPHFSFTNIRTFRHGIRNRPWFGSAPRVDKIQQTEFAGRILMSISANITEMPQRIEKAIRPIQPRKVVSTFCMSICTKLLH